MVNLDNLIVGDILAYKGGTSFLAKLIRFGTNSEYSHILAYAGKKRQILRRIKEIAKRSDIKTKRKLRKLALEVIRMKSTHYFIESDFSFRRMIFEKGYTSGVKFIPYKELIKRNGSHDVYRKKRKALNLLKFIDESILKVIGEHGYDFLGLFWRAIVLGRKKIIKKSTPIVLHSVNRYYCSELTKTIDLKCSKIPDSGLLPAETNPQSLLDESEMVKIGQI